MPALFTPGDFIFSKDTQVIAPQYDSSGNLAALSRPAKFHLESQPGCTALPTAKAADEQGPAELVFFLWGSLCQHASELLDRISTKSAAKPEKSICQSNDMPGPKRLKEVLSEKIISIKSARSMPLQLARELLLGQNVDRRFSV